MSITTPGDSRPETAPLRMKIRPAATADEFDPAEPSRPIAREETQPAISGLGEPVLQPATAKESTTPDPEPAAPTAPTVRRSFRQPATVTFTNRLSMRHRELLQELADAEEVTIRAILEQAIDLYASERHPDLIG